LGSAPVRDVDRFNRVESYHDARENTHSKIPRDKIEPNSVSVWTTALVSISVHSVKYESICHLFVMQGVRRADLVAVP